MILEQLYGGNIGPAHMPVREEGRAKYCTEEARRLTEQLEGKLNGAELDLFRKVQDADSATESSLAERCFVHGFKIAALMMAEVFVGGENELLNPELYWNSKARPRPVSTETEAFDVK